jgi:UDP-N-acetylmuramoyl-L-alanyl-D-glutamate--2,6-diaminopimelate ligase
MKLKELLADMPVTTVKSGGQLLESEIEGVTKDSREVREGYVFFATETSKPYLSRALEQKASVIVSDELLSGDIPCLVVTDDVRLLLARMAARFFGFPSRELSVTGITGTNGKTTITYLVESIVHAAGKKAGVIGTISYRYNNHSLKAPNTTPESVDIQSLLRDMKDEGVDHAVMEVSSHALDQHRVEDVDFDRAIFTNLTHDHLDYHKDLAHYREAKSLLFHRYLRQSVKERKHAIINIDDEAAPYMRPPLPVNTLTYSVNGEADAYLVDCRETIAGLAMEISLRGRLMKVSTPLIGLFNVSNILAATLFGDSADLPVDVIQKGIESLSGVPGRLERVPSEAPINVFVDYAHTPDALKKTIETLNKVRSGKLIVVFGCGGDRDRTKRPVMGRIVSQLADFAVITSDNPRSEDPRAITDEIRSGVTGNSYKIVENRRDAIAEALRRAGERDVVLVAGKGHEEYQIIGGITHPFSDRAVIEECLDVGA